MVNQLNMNNSENTWNTYKVIAQYNNGIGEIYDYETNIEGETYQRACFYFNNSHLFSSVVERVN